MVDLSKRIKIVGDFIRNRRDFLGISQRALGLFFEPPVTTQFISNVERGVTPLPPTHIAVLAKALKVSEDELMALLEKEYALKLNGKLGKTDGVSSNTPNPAYPSLSVSQTDYDFIQNLYRAYQSADSKTRQEFASYCNELLKLNRQNPLQ